MRFLVDANVLSEATKPQPIAAVLKWLQRHESRISVNPIILGELKYGILLLAAGKRRVRLEQWFAEGVARLQVLEMDGETGNIWATLLAELKRKGRSMPVKDSLIAATARQHGMTVATRNVQDYRYAGVKVENPFAP
ncbi:MAG: type II toxin-antitoxin system VapC family toxin [Pirellulaceae bacterium]